MRRRKFLFQAGSAAAAVCLAPRDFWADEHGDKVPTATLSVDELEKLATVPSDYTGLSYESAQLANPDFFSAKNTELIALVRELGADGVLRLGGGTSEFTAFTASEPSGPPPFDAVGPDTSKNVKGDTPISLESLKNLREFLDAVGWRCLYGLNLGRGSVERAAEEASYVQDILGPKLIAFQLGNEPDAWRNRYRSATWSYPDYWKEWTQAHAAVHARVPQAKFAGPDVSNKMAYVTGFAEDVKKNTQDVVMLTSHYYAMGPAGAKGITADKLLSPDPKLERDLKIAMDAAREAGLPYRMSEGNSCWNGGQEGVSDTLASALWVLDVMLNFAELGCAGVNLHGGGNGFYTPIVGGLRSGFTRRPEFFGMKLAKEFVGATMLRCKLECENDRVRAYAGQRGHSRVMVVINKTEQEVAVKTQLRRSHEHWLLTGPAMDAKEDVTLSRSGGNVLRNGVLHVAAHSAALVRA